jgi:hypothetical protein
MIVLPKNKHAGEYNSVWLKHFFFRLLCGHSLFFSGGSSIVLIPQESLRFFKNQLSCLPADAV